MSKRLQLASKSKSKLVDLPPDKRRKTESKDVECNENAELWNDDELDHIPEDVWEDCEIMASQAIEQQQSGCLQSDRGKHGKTSSLSSNTAHKKHNLSVGKGKPRSLSLDMATQNSEAPTFQQKSAVHNSRHFSSVINSKSAPSVCMGLSTNSSLPQSALRCETATCMNSDAYINPPVGMTGSGKISPSLPTSQGNVNSDYYISLQKELDKYRAEDERQKLELNKQKKDRYGLEGQIKMLRESLVQKEIDFNRLKKERSLQVEQQSKQHKEKEKCLQSEIDSLKIQLQFKEQEVKESQQVCGRLERQLRQGVGSSPVKTTASPKDHKMVKQAVSPRVKSNFPTRETFMGKGGQTADVTRKDVSLQVPDGSSQQTCEAPSRTLKCMNFKSHLQLKVSSSNGEVTGSQLTTKLMSPARQSTGIFDLLHYSTVQLEGMHLQTESSEKVSVPIPSTCRSQPAKNNPNNDCPPVSIKVPDPDNITLAYEGMDRLLQGHSRRVTSAGLSESCGCDVQSAVLLLPVIEDYLSTYLRAWQVSQQSSSQSSSGTSSDKSVCNTSSSADSSSNSATNSDSNDTYFRWLEKKSVGVLRLLSCLACYSKPARQAVITGHQDNTEPDHMTQRNTNSILTKLIQLCNPALTTEEHKCDSTGVAENALQVVKTLCEHCDSQSLSNLQPLLTLGVISNCLDICRDHSLVHITLDILKQMTRSTCLMDLMCRMPDYCIFASLYSVCSKTKDWRSDESTHLHGKAVWLMSSVISNHPNGAAILLDNDCHCSVEVVECIILMLHEELQLYKLCSAEAQLTVLRQGVQLLQTLKLFDRMYLDHRLDVEHQYVDIVCSLHVLFRKEPSLYENDVFNLQELWDFDQDDFSADSDTEDNTAMETE